MNQPMPRPDGRNDDPDLLPLETARLRAAVVWFAGSAILLLVLIAFGELSNLYNEKPSNLWAWALPTFMPTLGLVISVLVSSATMTEGARKTPTYVQRGVYQLSQAASVFYLVVLVCCVVYVSTSIPRHGDSKEGKGQSDESQRIEALAEKSYFLAPLQSVAVALLGAMFFRQGAKPPGRTAVAGRARGKSAADNEDAEAEK